MSKITGEKLERKPQPDIYCPVCLGYGILVIRRHPFVDAKTQQACSTCHGTGWITRRMDEK